MSELVIDPVLQDNINAELSDLSVMPKETESLDNLSIEELREKLAKVTGTRISPRYLNDKEWIKNRIVKEEEAKRMAEAESYNNEESPVFPEELTPCFIKGEPFAIINSKYVPWDEALVIAQENKVEYETQKLAILKSNLLSHA